MSSRDKHQSNDVIGVDENLIAASELRMRADDKAMRAVRIEICRPQQMNTGEYACRYRIIGIPPKLIDEMIYGEDSLQALCLCLQAIGARFYVFQKKRRIELFWPDLSPVDNLGLPVPPSVMDE